jgi:predicted XRE-type DNA-binding protein
MVVDLRRSGTLASSTTGLLRPNDSTEKGRINMATRRKRLVRAEKSSGNVFADLGLPDPEQELLRAKLTLEIYRLVEKRDLTQAEAGKILGIKQPHVSLLMRNRSGSFSVERLIDFLAALGQDVEISVRPASRNKAHGEVSVVA